jgi:hypothetical protein
MGKDHNGVFQGHSNKDFNSKKELKVKKTKGVFLNLRFYSD